MSSYDAIVIGGGHNGLVHAAYLAKAGRRVLVLERRHVVGGAAVTEEVFPGFHVSVCSYVVSLLAAADHPRAGLARHGLEVLPLDGTFTPMPTAITFGGSTIMAGRGARSSAIRASMPKPTTNTAGR